MGRLLGSNYRFHPSFLGSGDKSGDCHFYVTYCGLTTHKQPKLKVCSGMAKDDLDDVLGR